MTEAKIKRRKLMIIVDFSLQIVIQITVTLIVCKHRHPMYQILRQFAENLKIWWEQRENGIFESKKYISCVRNGKKNGFPIVPNLFYPRRSFRFSGSMFYDSLAILLSFGASSPRHSRYVMRAFFSRSKS